MTTECAVRAGPVNVRSSRFPALTPEQMRTLPLPPPRPRKIKPGRPNFKIGQENRRVTEDASRAGSARQRGREALWASEEGCIPLCPRDHNDLKALRRDGFAEEVISEFLVLVHVLEEGRGESRRVDGRKGKDGADRPLVGNLSLQRPGSWPGGSFSFGTKGSG